MCFTNGYSSSPDHKCSRRENARSLKPCDSSLYLQLGELTFAELVFVVVVVAFAFVVHLRATQWHQSYARALVRQQRRLKCEGPIRPTTHLRRRCRRRVDAEDLLRAIHL